jgi:GNAT superfamily N-acetyltransferase
LLAFSIHIIIEEVQTSRRTLVIRYRWAKWEDLEELLDLIATGFAIWPDGRADEVRGREHRLLFSYLYSRPDWRPDRVAVGEVDRRLAAAVGFFPQQLHCGAALLPVWAVSPVVVHPDRQRNGYGGDCLHQALAWLGARGIPAVFLWGIPAFYPQFGFVPLLPRYKTKLARDRFHKPARLSPGRLRFVQTADLEALSALYHRGDDRLWLQPQRTGQWWADRMAEMNLELAELKEVPFPKQANFRVWENCNGEPAGYLYYSDPAGLNPLTVTEAAALNPEEAAAMLSAFMEQCVAPGTTVVIRGTPQHYLNWAAYRCGGTHLNPAPLAGMVKVLDWPAFGARFIPAVADRLSGWDRTAVVPFCDGEAVWELTATAAGLTINAAPTATPVLTGAQLTRLFFGLADAADWEALPPAAQALQHIFPSRYPFIWDANYLY